MNRWRQLQEPTLSLDGLWDDGTNCCELDLTRVANTKCDLPGRPNANVSRTTRDRRENGRGARQGFYRDELPKLGGRLDFEKLIFTDDLKALAGRHPDESSNANSIPGNLVDKLAVFHVDGNRFGQRGRDILHAHGTAGYREWSDKLRNHHRQLLNDLLNLAIQDPLWQTYNPDEKREEVRLETLLWGGDEILWVVPAWKGWEVARWFFSQPHQISISGRDKPYDLTYVCGLVFCHAKAPIRNITQLAHRLGDLAKQARGNQNVHRLAYEVLESYDDVSGDLETHRGRFLPENDDPVNLVIDPTRLQTCWKTLERIAAPNSEFPMRQLYLLIQEWKRGGDFTKHESRLLCACEECLEKDKTAGAELQLRQLFNAFPQPYAWLHLLQWLPYLSSSPDSKPEAAK